jgi:hypothetical protein
LWGVSPPSLPGREVSRIEDKKRKKVSLWEAAEYPDLTPGEVKDMVERGVLEAEKFAAAIHIPYEEVLIEGVRRRVKGFLMPRRFYDSVDEPKEAVLAALRLPGATEILIQSGDT